MMTSVKTREEMNLMRESGKILHEVIVQVAAASKPGTNLLDLDKLAEKVTHQHDAICSFKGFHGYPANICLSLNDEIVHSIPKDIELKEGDILGIDMGVTYEGFVTDSAVTIAIGKVEPKVAQFLRTNQETLAAVIKIIKDGIQVGDIGAFIQDRIELAGYGIVKELTGHGVGRNLHEDPFIPNYGRKGTGPTLKAGMTVAIEPIITMGKPDITVDNDDWTIRSKDHSLGSQFEHTLIIHEDHAEIIT